MNLDLLNTEESRIVEFLYHRNKQYDEEKILKLAPTREDRITYSHAITNLINSGIINAKIVKDCKNSKAKRVFSLTDDYREKMRKNLMDSYELDK